MAKKEFFNGYSNMVQVIAQEQNKIVREEFSDVAELDLDDFDRPRSVLRAACMIDASEKSIMTIVLKMLFFYILLRKARDLQQPYYGIPIGTDEAQRKYKPQIELFFQQDWEDLDDVETRVEGRISFRLMNETATTITKSELTNLAKEIKTKFAIAGGYKWKKGKDMCSYTDRDKGYQLQLLVFNKTGAKDLIKDVLSIQNHTPDWSKMQYKENEAPSEAYPMIRGNKTILGKVYKEPRLRPTETVRFQYAVAKVHGIGKPIPLVDRSGTFFDPLVR